MFGKTYQHFQKFNILFRLTVSLLLMVVPFLLRSQSNDYDFIFAPMFIFGLVSVVKEIKYTQILFPITLLGKYSLLIWFLHCAYANQLKYYTQPGFILSSKPNLSNYLGTVYVPCCGIYNKKSNWVAHED